MSADVLQLHIPRESEGHSTFFHSHHSMIRPSTARRYPAHSSTNSQNVHDLENNAIDEPFTTAHSHTFTQEPTPRRSPPVTMPTTQNTPDARTLQEDIEPDLSLYESFEHQRRNSKDVETPPSSPAWGLTEADETAESLATDTDTTRSDSPLATPTIADDTFVKQPPSRQVDFLSHEWREEDIWSSWRHIVSQRRTYGEKSRLENASWRTWTKTKYRLPTVSPEKLNWLKESDVTWLYGPLQPARSYPITNDRSIPSSHISKSNSFVNKKPILKKRSVSEIMLQKSLSSSSLLKQATASVQAQGGIDRRCAQMSDIFDSKLHSVASSRDQFDYFTSQSTSALSTPGGEPQERKHIRFDDRVEQCIAVEAKLITDEDDDEDFSHEEAIRESSDSESDEGVMMRMGGSGRSTPKRSRSNSLNGMKTIETLPATTLKYRMDSPDITVEAQHHTFGRSWGFGRLGQSPSQETLRPANPANNFLIPEEDEEDDQADGNESSWSFGSNNPKSSLGASAGRNSGYEIEGMRRTGSGMFMPYDDDEDDGAAQGLFGRVSETINTARDIAHVIWNVGWRK